MIKKIKDSIINSSILNDKKITNVAINGFGRIGRMYLKLSLTNPNINVIAINDLGNIENMAYLLRYDTAYRHSNDIETTIIDENDLKYLIISSKSKSFTKKKILFCAEKDIVNLPWAKNNIDIVIESTGLFTTYTSAYQHITSGAKRVIISAPVKIDKDAENLAKTVLMGVNEYDLGASMVSSNASCTTNASSPIIAILKESIGIEKAILNTVHSYTASQSIVDGPNKKDWREGRAAAQNMVPSSTGAAKAVGTVITDLQDKFDGISIRVPTPVGSIADITFIASRNTSVEEINDILTKASKSKRWQKVFKVTEEELVSSDIIGESHASIADLKMTRVVDGNLCKVLAWYDNEFGYTNTLISHTEEVIKYL